MTSAASNFNGADGTQLPTFDPNWLTTGNAGPGSFVLLSNGATSPLAGASITLFNSFAGTWGNDQSSQIVVKQVPSGGQLFGVAVRVSSGNCYYFVADNGGWIFGKTVAFSVSPLGAGSGPITLALNDILRLEVSGSSVVAKINGVAVASATDTDVTSGNPGLASLSLSGSGTSFVADDWAAADTLTGRAWNTLFNPNQNSPLLRM